MAREARHGRTALRMGLLLLVAGVVGWTPRASSTDRSALQSTSALPPASIHLHGTVRDAHGSGLLAAIWILNDQGLPVGDQLTDEQGAYEVTVPGSERLSVKASPLAVFDSTDGYQYARYFDLTRVILPTSDDFRLDFVVPSAAALTLQAYSPSGEWMAYDAFYEAINPSGFYGYQGVYGVFPLADLALPVPVQASVGLFRAASHPEQGREEWRPYFSVPPGEAGFLMLPWEVPGAGTFPLRADNRGQGYHLAEGEATTINLVYELAETEYRRTVELRSSYSEQGQEFGAAVIDGLMLAGESLAAARGETDAARRAIHSYEVLRQSILARETMTLEAAERGIEERKSGLTVAVRDLAGQPVAGATLAYRQIHSDFVLGQFGELPLYAYLPATYKACKEIGFESLYHIGYWRKIEPQRGVYDFSEVDRGLERARVEGWEAVVGIAWLGADNVPAWAEDLEFSEFKAALREVVQAYVGHLQGRIKVLNVAIEPTIQTFAGSRYVEVESRSGYSTGVQQAELIELLRTAFDAAREVDSGILLGYSVDADYGYGRLNPSSFGGWPCPYSFLQSALQGGVSPDYVGVEIYAAQGGLPLDLSTVAASIQAYHDLSGLPVVLTEVGGYSSRTDDYGLTGPVPNYYWHEHMTRQAQADWDTSVFRIAMGLPYVFGVMMTHGGPDWPGYQAGLGITDCLGIANCYSIGTDFVTQQYERKPVYYALQSLFEGWRSSGSTVTDDNGAADWTGLAGDYAITVTTASGLEQAVRTHLGAGVSAVTITDDVGEARQDLALLVGQAQAALDWSLGLGRQLDYGPLRQSLVQARSDLSAGEYGSARALANQVVQATAITLDGDPSDWRGVAPLGTLLPGGVPVEVRGIDLRSVYGMTDDEFLYLMVEVYDPPIRLQPESVGPSDIRYPQFNFTVKVEGAADWTHVLGAYLPYGGQVELHDAAVGRRTACLYSVAYGQVLELRVPLALLGNAARMGVVPYVVAATNGEAKAVKGFEDYVQVRRPRFVANVPLIDRQ